MAYKIYIQITYISACCCLVVYKKWERYSYAALEVGSVQFVLVVVAVLRFTFKTFTFN